VSADQRLSALDTTFLELEDADVSAHMHIGALLVFAGEAPTRAELIERIEARLPGLPRYRQRLSDVQVGTLHRPAWTFCETFDLKDHVTVAGIPAPAGEAGLLAWAAEFFSQRLDRRRPLWELVLIPGLPGDAWALASKTHHCLTDGIGSLDTLRLIVDGMEAVSVDAPAGREEPSPIDFVRAAFGLARHPLDTLKASAAVAELAVREELQPAPESSVNVPIGIHRRLAVANCSLADLKHAKNTLGGTVNDVVLAVVTAGLRDLLLARGQRPPAAGLRAMVPLNVRPPGDGADMGNRILSLFVTLPVAEPDVRRRFEIIRDQTAAAKHGHQVAGTAGLLGLAEWIPPVLHVPFSKSMFGKRLFNVTVTNIAGPPVVPAVFGSALRQAIPIVPLAAEHAVGVAILSQGGEVTFCVNADHDAAPDADVVADGIQAGLLDLYALVGTREALAARIRASRSSLYQVGVNP
jgi:diacylglycerol O-acyltransferase / wax synthase